MNILVYIKHQLGIPEDYIPFDDQLIGMINTALVIMEQTGVTTNAISITGSSDFSEFPEIDKPSVKSYLFAKVSYEFDRTDSSILEGAKKEFKNETEWRAIINGT